MKYKKLRKLIQRPLRFHHQDIHEELEALKAMITLQQELLWKILEKLDDEDGPNAAMWRAAAEYKRIIERMD
jgi:hypothetical protein